LEPRCNRPFSETGPSSGEAESTEDGPCPRVAAGHDGGGHDSDLAGSRYPFACDRDPIASIVPPPAPDFFGIDGGGLAGVGPAEPLPPGSPLRLLSGTPLAEGYFAGEFDMWPEPVFGGPAPAPTDLLDSLD
jgi:hypothetical protein